MAADEGFASIDTTIFDGSTRSIAVLEREQDCIAPADLMCAPARP